MAGLVNDSATGVMSLKQRVSHLGRPRTIRRLVPVPVLSATLFERFTSRGNADFANRVLSAMRYEFGGHIDKPAS